MATKSNGYKIHRIPGRPKKTLKQRIIDAMIKKGGKFIQLNELYSRLRMNSHVEKAEVRGILNRSVIDQEGLFIRGQRRKGLYKVA